jgi:hypothetical protein
MFFKNRSQNKTRKTEIDNESSDKNNEAFKLGSSIAKLITSSWNSQENPGKVYIFKRRVHHGGVGAILGLSNLFRNSQPIPSGILSGLGGGLAEDDYADRDSWFTFDKKPTDNVGIDDDSLVSQTSSLPSSASSTTINSSNTDYNTSNEMYQEANKTTTIEKTKESSPN